LLALFVSKVYL